ncbi:MAG: sulfatase-like hydrolase/transferase [Verrucomicrobiota bacterium]|nr:sulfatase-like hydrolase/transferase [Verrucomicrobiota bacterium]
MKSIFHPLPLALLLIFSLQTANADQPAASLPKPNIVLIMADDLGLETMGSYGGTPYKTPNLDRLAANGMRFEHCYAQPICTPSRVQLMTGQYNVRNYTKFGLLPRGEVTFAHKLKAKGYATCIAGKWQLGREKDAPQHFGFEEALLWQHTRDGRMKIDGTRVDKRYENPILEKNGEPLAYNDGEFAPDLMVDFILDFIERKAEQPFLVYYPMILTHCPFVPTPHSEDWDPTSAGSPTHKGDKAYFGDMVEYVDHLVGKIEAELERHGLLENTYLIFTGDNGTDRTVVSMLKGEPFPGRKGTLTNGGTHVPLIVSRPGTVPAKVHNDLIDFSDFLPTFCEIANSSTDGLTLDGNSFLPQLHGETGNPREFVYCWYNRDMKHGKTQVTARNQRYKLYKGGKFYDIPNDLQEKQPLVTNSLTPEQVAIKEELQEVLNHYEQFDRLAQVIHGRQ